MLITETMTFLETSNDPHAKIKLLTDYDSKVLQNHATNAANQV
jgi:hypothetical protein